MSETTKLDPRGLTAIVRETYPPPPPLAGWIGFYFDSSGDAPEDAGWFCSGKVHPTQEEALCELAGFRPFEGSAVVEVGRALFGDPASEAEKVKCPNCGEMTSEPHIGKFIPGHWCCPKPAQPEPDHFGARLDGVGANVNAALLLHRNGDPDSAIASEIGKAMLALKELLEEIRERSPIVPPSPEPAAPVGNVDLYGWVRKELGELLGVCGAIVAIEDVPLNWKFAAEIRDKAAALAAKVELADVSRRTRFSPPAAPVEMPEAVREAANYLRQEASYQFDPPDRSDREKQMRKFVLSGAADALECEWRTHSQQVAFDLRTMTARWDNERVLRERDQRNRPKPQQVVGMTPKLEISELDDRHMRMASPEVQAKFRADMDRQPEPAKVCGNDGMGQEWPCVLPEMHSGPCHQPAPPEPAQPEPAAPVEMPEAMRNAIDRMRWIADHNCGPYFQEWGKPVREAAAGLETFWRTHAQPVGISPELEMVLSIADEAADKYVNAGWNEAPKKWRNAIAAVRSQYGRKG